MLGYHNNEEATAITIKDNWLFTGDVGNEIFLCVAINHGSFLINLSMWSNEMAIFLYSHKM